MQLGVKNNRHSNMNTAQSITKVTALPFVAFRTLNARKSFSKYKYFSSIKMSTMWN